MKYETGLQVDMHQHKTIIPGKNENDGDPMQMAGKVEELQEIISRSKRIVFFGGAGVSTASGIPDFRSETGKRLVPGDDPEQELFLPATGKIL